MLHGVSSTLKSAPLLLVAYHISPGFDSCQRSARGGNAAGLHGVSSTLKTGSFFLVVYTIYREVLTAVTVLRAEV